MNAVRQRGFLLIAAIVLVVILSFFALVITDLFTGDTRTATYGLESTQALFLAEAGLERAGQALLSPTVYAPASPNNRINCAGLATVPGTVNEGSGSFMVTGASPDYGGDANNGALVLASAISSTSTVIPLTGLGSLPDYAPAGRVRLDTEALDYSAISQSAGVCGGAAACLIGVVRGVDGTQAVAHAGGTPAGEYQCPVRAQGVVPVAGSKVRTLAAGVELQEGWAVGSVGAAGTELLHWVGNQWVNATVAVPGVPTLNGVECQSYADCWAVGSGNFGTSQAIALHWNGSVWHNWSTALPGAVANTDLDNAACTDYADCWFAGGLLQGKFALVHMTGGGATPVFTRITPGAAGAKGGDDLDGIACVQVNLCWAVGSVNAGKTVLLEWNGTVWSNVTRADVPVPVRPNNDLDAVTCSASTCWAVGSVGGGTAVILQWTAAAGWAQVAAPATLAPLDTVTCSLSGDCWAAGSLFAGPALAHWDGSRWTDVTASLPGTVTGDLDHVACVASDDCWVVGSATTGTATLVHWDGASWSDLSAAVGGTDLEGVSLVGPAAAPRSAWQELYP